MASPGDYKELNNKWPNKTHTVGSPDLDAFIEISNRINPAFGATSGELKVISRDLSLTAGDSIGFKITATGGTFIKFIHAEGFNIKYLSDLSGTTTKAGTAKSLNLTGNDDHIVNYLELAGVTFNTDDVVISHISELNIGIYSDNDVYAILTNDTATTIDSAFTIGIQKINDFTSTLGLMPTTLLQPTTEMSNYG